MRCSNCGADVPFTGKVCPLCHADKSGDQAVHALGIVFGLAGAGIGWVISPPCAGPMVGLIAGMVVGIAAGMAGAKK